MGLLFGMVEEIPSMTSWSFPMDPSQASHCSPSPGQPQNLGMLSYGRRPSRSFARMRTRIALASITVASGGVSGNVHHARFTGVLTPGSVNPKAEVQAGRVYTLQVRGGAMRSAGS